MHIDARKLDNDSLIEGDICIVGAGAAGISMALQWINTPHKVILLEGGGFNFEPELQDLYRGENVGQTYYPLEAARLHYFGGTTGHWGGFCAPLDPIDFKRREWVPYSGWPITLNDLDPYYAQTQQLAELGPYNYTAAYWEQQDPEVIRLPLDVQQVWTKMWQFSPPTRFGSKYRDQIINANNIYLYTYANVCEVLANDQITATEGLSIRTLDGKQHQVRARYYVLACGAIQNARLLLVSNRQAQTGLGNAYDLVGRFFMEHLEMPIAELALTRPQTLKLYLMHYGQTKSSGELALTDQAQQEYRILNGTASLKPGTADKNTRSTFQEFSPDVLAQYNAAPVEALPRATSSATAIHAEPAVPRYRNLILSTRHEQSPNPDSRIMLADDTDALGMHRTRLDWQLTELDKYSIRTFTRVLARQFGLSNLGRVKIMDWLHDEDNRSWPNFLSGGWHHMGTTRMHADPQQGVVDANCQIHGINNLFIAGSSVFPTGGSCNPTLTLIALSLRLADHLKQRLG